MTRADRAATGADRAGTGADRAGTGADSAGTGADRAGTGADGAGTPADRAGTGADRARLPATVWILGGVSLLMDFSSELIHGLLPIYLTTTLGVGALALGWIEGVAEATAMIVKIFSGVWSDALGRRKPLLLAGYGLAALTKPLFPLASGAGLVFAARFVDRIGKGIRGAPRDALIADVTPVARQGAAYGLRQSLDTVGAILGPLAAIALIAGAFGVTVGVRGALWFAVIPAAAAFLLLALALPRESPRPAREAPTGASHFHGGDVRAPRAPGFHGADVPALRGRGFRRADLRALGRACWAVIALGAVFQLARFSEAFLVLRVAAFGSSAAWGPAALAVMSAVYAVVSYPAGVLADRVDRRTLLAAGLVVLIAADAFLAIATDLRFALAGVALWGLHMGLTQGVLSAMVAAVAPERLRASAFGAFSLLSGVVLLGASVLAGALWERVDPAATFVAGGIVSLAALAALPFVRAPAAAPASH